MRPAVRSAEPDVSVVAAYVTERAGLSFAGSRGSHLFRQITEAMARAGASTGQVYCSMLDQDEAEFDELVARITIGESYFFREPGQLAALRTLILPERRAARSSGAPLRLWSAGCATGQEAYTLAIVLEEEGLVGKAEIVATDISPGALRVAQARVYGRWSLRAVTDRQRDAYFRAGPAGFRIDERFADRITFRHANLLAPTGSEPRDIDVIFCRNVLIYFTFDAVRQAAERLAAALAPRGWLVTGSSDPPLEGIAGLEPTVTAAGLVYRRSPPAARSELPQRTPARMPTRKTTTTASLARTGPARPAAAWSKPVVADRTADETARIVRTRGGAGDLPGALAAVAEGIERFPVHTELRYLQAVVLLEAGQPANAAGAARAALYLEPTLVMGHVTLAQAEATLGDRPAARRSLRNAAGLLDALPPDATVPLTDGETAGRLAAMVAAHDRAVASTGQRRQGADG